MARQVEALEEAQRKMSFKAPPPASCCALPECLTAAFMMGLCATHWLTFSSAPEYARAKTALSDFIRRTEGEKRNGE